MKKTIMFLLCLSLFAAVYAANPAGGAPNDSSDAILKDVEGLSGSAPDKGSKVTGARSRESIQRVVVTNMWELRRTYAARLLDWPDTEGIITIRFVIDEYGKVVTAKVAHTTVKDPPFENIIMTLVKSWDFGPVNKAGDNTQVVYPFAFTQ